jgi:hypothetical protein
MIDALSYYPKMNVVLSCVSLVEGESNVLPVNEQMVMAKGNDDPAVTVADEIRIVASPCPQDRYNGASFRVGREVAERDYVNTQGTVTGSGSTVSDGKSVCGWNSVRFTNTLLRRGSLITCMLASISLAGCGTDLASPLDSFVTLTSSNRTMEGRVWGDGIVVPGQPASVSFPLEDPAIRSTSDIDVKSVKTSSECVVAIPFDCIDSHGKSGVAVRLDINGRGKRDRLTSI